MALIHAGDDTYLDQIIDMEQFPFDRLMQTDPEKTVTYGEVVNGSASHLSPIKGHLELVALSEVLMVERGRCADA